LGVRPHPHVSSPSSPLTIPSVLAGNDSDTIKIHLHGLPQAPLTIHRKLLVAHSPYFHRLLQTNGTGDQTLDGLECLSPSSHLISPTPFELFTQYLYTGRIDPVPPKSSVSTPRYNLFAYIRVWILCDAAHFQVPALQDLALQRMKQYYHQRAVKLNVQQVRYIYANTAKGSALRTLVAEEAVHEFMKTPGSEDANPRVTGEHSYEYSVEDVHFAADMLAAAKRGIKNGWPHPFNIEGAPEPSPPHSPLVELKHENVDDPPELSNEASPLAVRDDPFDPVTPGMNSRFGDSVLIGSSETHEALQDVMQGDTLGTMPVGRKLFGGDGDGGGVIGVTMGDVPESGVVVKKAITI
jgi:hypothetical protein